MTVQHKSLRDEILFVVGRSSLPLNSGEIYERVQLAEEMKQVSNGLFQLHAAGKLQRIEGEGRVRYALTSGVATPALASKAGRPQELPVAPAPIMSSRDGIQSDIGIRPYSEPSLPKIAIPALGDPGISLNGAAGKTQRAKADKPKSDHFAGAGKMVQVVDVDASAARLADAMLAKSRQKLRPQAEPAPLRWWINQDGGVELAHPDAIDTITLSAHQAIRLATMVMAVHDELGHP